MHDVLLRNFGGENVVLVVVGGNKSTFKFYRQVANKISIKQL